MPYEVRIPTLGESVTEGTIVRWAKRDGEAVAADEVLLELETDKASMEIAAERSGTVRIVKPEGSTVSVGDVVARIEEGPARSASAPPTTTAAEPPPAAPEVVDDARPALATPAVGADVPGEQLDSRGVEPVPAEGMREAGDARAAAPSPPQAASAPEGSRGRAVGPLSPAVRHLTDEYGLDPAKIPASGKGGRLTKEDVLAHIERTAAKPRSGVEASAPAVRAPATPEPVAAQPPPRPQRTADRGDEIVAMSRLRKRIAERLVQAKQTAAILTTFNEIDMSAVMALRSEHKELFQKKHGVALGFMSFFARACVIALRDLPVVNAEIRDDSIVYKHYVHLGVAVGTDRGLVVPVVKDADLKSFADLEREIARLASLARDGKLSIDDLAGGTFTISNGGVYGSLMSTPILNPPQSAILGMHKIQKRPVAIADQVVIRPMMYVALSYDHRLVDGEQAVTFLVRVKERLESPARLLLDL